MGTDLFCSSAVCFHRLQRTGRTHRPCCPLHHSLTLFAVSFLSQPHSAVSVRDSAAAQGPISHPPAMVVGLVGEATFLKRCKNILKPVSGLTLPKPQKTFPGRIKYNQACFSRCSLLCSQAFKCIACTCAHLLQLFAGGLNLQLCLFTHEFTT